MSRPAHDRIAGMLSGSDRSPRAKVFRALARPASALYAALMRLRNRRYDSGKGVRRLPRPVVSIGNITTGGTGKTPVVQWLCGALRAAGHHPAILMRGYKARPGQKGDEQLMLESLLAPAPGQSAIAIHADPDRYRGGMAVIDQHPETTVFILDDGFQHRRLARDADLVLIDATNPFGYGHVLPRGLLREPMAGLHRAGAILISRSDQIDPREIERIISTLHNYNTAAPIFRSVHRHVGLRAASGESIELSALASRKFFAFAGIGNPAGLCTQLEAVGAIAAGAMSFSDHWNYSAGDAAKILSEAHRVEAHAIITTEKDWVKIGPSLERAEIPVYRLDLAIEIDGEEELMAWVMGQLANRREPVKT